MLGRENRTTNERRESSMDANDPRSVYAETQIVTEPTECDFYHTMVIPGWGETQGQWDLRGKEQEYLGNVDLAGKRVLEVGTASGYLCFWMEKEAGADVVAYDLSENDDWDVVPYAAGPVDRIRQLRKSGIRRQMNAWWFVHRVIDSKARVVYGSVYDIPAAIGPVDVSTVCSVLLHFRDPFQALYKASLLTRDTMIVTDLVSPTANEKLMHFRPVADDKEPWDTWWWISEALVVEMLAVLGFADTTITHHEQQHSAGPADLFTVVGRRTSPFETPGSP
jgi:hypothetical protein